MRVRLIGYWCDTADRSPDEDDHWPNPRGLIDESWSNAARDRVASYFERGFEVWQLTGFSDCRLCGKLNGSAELTDGVYLWPEGSIHYVGEHSVKLPEEVLAHIRRRYEEVESLEVDRDWSAEYTDRVFLPEGALDDVRENFGELPEDVLAHLLHSDEVETLVVDGDWWAKVTSA